VLPNIKAATVVTAFFIHDILKIFLVKVYCNSEKYFVPLQRFDEFDDFFFKKLN